MVSKVAIILGFTALLVAGAFAVNERLGNERLANKPAPPPVAVNAADDALAQAKPEPAQEPASGAETKPAGINPEQAEPQPTEPVQAKPVDVTPVETKPAEAQAVEAKPAEAKPAEAKPVEAKPVDTKPADMKPAEITPVTPQPTEAAAPPVIVTPPTVVAEPPTLVPAPSIVTAPPAPMIVTPPTETPAPVVTAPPATTSAPVVTAPPAETPVPVVTAPPTATPAPVVTAPPDATPAPAPVVTAPPAATPTPAPVVTAPPAEAPAPVVTAPPPLPAPAPVVVLPPAKSIPMPHERPSASEQEKILATAKALFAAEKLPSLGKAMAIGYYPRGCLSGGVALPVNGPTWQVMRVSRNRNWGHPSLVRYLEKFAPLAAKATGWKGILVGDMAQPRGGPTPYGHRSHQTGLDVDIWFMPMPGHVLSKTEREKTSATNLVAADWKHVNPKTWTPQHADFIRVAAEQPEVERVLVNAAIKKEMCRMQGKKHPEWMDKVRPWYAHHDHIHVRLQCPAGSPNCRKQPPVPGSDGCGKALNYWFSDRVLHPKPKKKGGKPPRPVTLADMPPACKTVLAAPDKAPNN